MAGRGRVHPDALDAGRGPLSGAGVMRSAPGPYGPGLRPPLDMLPASPLEHKLAIQHTEIQSLLTENQRLAATHVALRQELAAAQQELQRLQQVLGGVQAEKEQQLRGLAERAAKMEADLLATEPLKIELQKCQADVQKLSLHRQELTAQVQQISQDLLRARADAQQIPGMKSDIEALRQEVQRARTAFEYEKKANTELLQQRQVMDKNLVTLVREVEKLRAELTNAEKAPVGGYGTGFGGPDSGYPSANAYGDGYGIAKMGAAADSGAPYGAGAAPAWGAYDIQRAGGPHPRR